MDNEYGKFTFIDTAGLRRKGKVEDGVERYAVLRSLAAVERARVCVILIDALDGFTEQDSKVAGFAHEQGKACIIAVNKWDAIEKDDKTMDKMRKKLEGDFSFISMRHPLYQRPNRPGRQPVELITMWTRRMHAGDHRYVERSAGAGHGARAAAVR